MADSAQALAELFELAKEENDESSLEQLIPEVDALDAKLHELELRRMFSDPMDPGNCFIEIQAGAGGTEAQDWAAMLERMYLRYC